MHKLTTTTVMDTQSSARVLSEEREFVNHQGPGREGSKYRRNYHIRKPLFLLAGN